MLHKDRDPDKPHSLFISLTMKPLLDGDSDALDNYKGLQYSDCMNTALRAAREEAGMTREQLAKRIGCTATSVYNWEMRGITPMPPYLAKIKRVLGIDVKEVSHEDRNESPAPR